MATANIDRLEIEVDAASSAAVQHIKELSSALTGMRRSAQNATTGLSGVVQQLKALKTTGTGASKSLKVVKNALGAIGYRQIAKYLGSAVTSINEYVENVNLFQVAMGQFYQEAYDYAQLVSEKLGVDPSQWMRTQGVFMSMANGFGMAEDKAYALSEGLTELSYDISSLYNEDIEKAATRLQSALAGEIEPIRRLGISISQATLEEYALTNGINESVASMTEQEKALLRSLKLIEGAADIGAIGDFAKTLESPANAMRVLNAQFTQFKRAIGSVLLPVIIQVLPYVQALVSLLTDLISRLAVLVGFKMPTWDTKSWEKSFGGASKAVDDTTGAVKKLKNETIGLDELNIISPDTGKGTGAGGISGWADDLEIPDLWDKNAIAQIETESQRIKAVLEDVLTVATAIGVTFLGWKIAQGVPAAIRAIKDAMLLLNGHLIATTPAAQKLATAMKLAGVAGAIWVVIERFKDLYENNENFRTGVERVGQVLDGLRTVAGDVFGGIVAWLGECGIKFSDFGLVALGIAMMFLPGGKLGGAIILGFEAISIGLRALGLVSEEEWQSMVSDMSEWWNTTKKSMSEIWKNLKDGWTNFWKNVKTVAAGAINGLITAVEKGINWCINALNSISFSLPEWIPGIGGKSFALNLKPVTLGRIELFANGGFPDHGQMFVARERGPELVGTIGQKSAVVNNEQIIDGIRAGVYDANAEQNSLLEEQNSLLRAILAKEGRVYLDPKTAKRAVDRAEQSSGYNISAGGVMVR